MQPIKLKKIKCRPQSSAAYLVRRKPSSSCSQRSLCLVKSGSSICKKKKRSCMTVSPSNQLVFRRKNVDGQTGRLVSSLVLRNTNKNEQLCFKIKTNNPSHYHINPSTGFINANSSAKINICLLSGCEQTMLGDKFLIMYQRNPVCLSQSNPRDFWQTQAAKDHHHKRRVRVKFIEEQETEDDNLSVSETIVTEYEESEEEFQPSPTPASAPMPYSRPKPCRPPSPICCGCQPLPCQPRCPIIGCQPAIKKLPPNRCKPRPKARLGCLQETRCELLDNEFQRIRDTEYQRLVDNEKRQRRRDSDYEDLTSEVSSLRNTLETVECGAEELRNNLRWSMWFHAFAFFVVAYFVIQYYALLARSDCCGGFYR